MAVCPLMIIGGHNPTYLKNNISEFQCIEELCSAYMQYQDSKDNGCAIRIMARGLQNTSLFLNAIGNMKEVEIGLGNPEDNPYAKMKEDRVKNTSK